MAWYGFNNSTSITAEFSPTIDILTLSKLVNDVQNRKQKNWKINIQVKIQRMGTGLVFPE